MKPIQRFFFPVVAASVFTFASAVLVEKASAVSFDHLKCYTARDTRFTSHPLVALTPALAPFAAETGCKFIGEHPHAKYVCTPVEKTPNFLGAGQNLHGNYLCYVMKCPREAADLTVAAPDQLGSGSVTAKARSQHRLLCVPAPPVYGSPAKAFLSPTTSLLDD